MKKTNYLFMFIVDVITVGAYYFAYQKPKFNITPTYIAFLLIVVLLNILYVRQTKKENSK